MLELPVIRWLVDWQSSSRSDRTLAFTVACKLLFEPLECGAFPQMRQIGEAFGKIAGGLAVDIAPAGQFLE